MRHAVRLSVLASALAISAACGGGSSTPAPEQGGCDLSLDALGGRTFVWLEESLQHKGPNPMARVRFEDQGGTLHALYTAKSGTRVYDYTCTKKEGVRPSLECAAVPDFKRACLALEVLKTGGCSVDALAAAGFPGDAATLGPIVEETAKLVAAARTSPDWDQFAAVANNIGNKIQGKLGVSIPEGSCRLKVEDRYVALYNGQRSLEDNAVGRSDFLPSDEAFLFEDCKPETTLVDLDVDALPADPSTIPAVREHATGAAVHYHVLPHTPDEVKAEEGCTYAVDTWANGRPVATGAAVEVKDGHVQWHASHVWKPEDLVLLGKEEGMDVTGAVFHMKRSKTCAGAGTTIDVACNMARLVPGAGGAEAAPAEAPAAEGQAPAAE